jgi:hypothetical protein
MGGGGELKMKRKITVNFDTEKGGKFLASPKHFLKTHPSLHLELTGWAHAVHKSRSPSVLLLAVVVASDLHTCALNNFGWRPISS